MSKRLIPLEGGYNFRHIGDYVTQGATRTKALIYRSGNLVHLTDADRQHLAQLGIKTVFDLREAEEYDEEGYGQVGDGVEIVYAPTTLDRNAIRARVLRDAAGFRMADVYIDSMAPRQVYHAELFGKIVQHLDAPLVVHCSAGKDRTGIIVALMLQLAGVSDEQIVADYVETEQHLVAYAERRRVEFMGYGMPENVADELLSSSAKTMQKLLAHLNESYGSAEAYLRGGGVRDDQIALFRQRFVE